MSKRKNKVTINNNVTINQYNIEIVLFKTRIIKIENIFNVVLFQIIPWIMVLTPWSFG